MDKLEILLKQDLIKAKNRLDAFMQAGTNLEGIAWNKSCIIQIQTTLFDIRQIRRETACK